MPPSLCQRELSPKFWATSCLKAHGHDEYGAKYCDSFAYWAVSSATKIIVYWFSLCTDLVLYLWLMCFRLVFLDLIASQALLFWVMHTSPTCSLDYVLDLFVADLNKLQLDSTTSASSSPSQNTSLTRNPDDVNQLQAFFTHQGEVLVAYYKQLTALQTANTHLLQALCALPAGRPEPLKIAMGEKFDRSAIAVSDFSGSAMHILHTNLRHTERTAPNVPFFSHLDWASAVWDSNEQVQGAYKYCTQLNKDAFEYYYSCVRNQVQQWNTPRNSGCWLLKVAEWHAAASYFSGRTEPHIADK